MKKLLLITAVLALSYGTYYYFRPLGPKVRIGSTVIPVEVAVTEPQKQLGLGNRDSLDPDKGMVFVYDHKEAFNFWMRGMRFPLDFIWIDGNTVADITQNVRPPSDGETPAIVKPRVPVDKILEVNAGFVTAHGIEVGDMVQVIDR